jgi:hypothetical protein
MRKFFSLTKGLVFRSKSSFSEISQFKNNFLSVSNLDYIESMYENWLQDKKSVSSSFSAYFELLEKG